MKKQDPQKIVSYMRLSTVRENTALLIQAHLFAIGWIKKTEKDFVWEKCKNVIAARGGGAELAFAIQNFDLMNYQAGAFKPFRLLLKKQKDFTWRYFEQEKSPVPTDFYNFLENTNSLKSSESWAEIENILRLSKL